MSLLAKTLLNRNVSNTVRRLLFNGQSSTLTQFKPYSEAADRGEGLFQRTTLNRLNEEDSTLLQITGYNKHSFYINKKIQALGPIIVFPRTIYSWNIADENEVNEKSLSLFTIIEPKLDILIIGIGDRDQKVNPEIPKWLIKNKITNFEILPTEKAINAFNFLVADNRFVGAALIPTEAFSKPNLDTIKHMERSSLYHDSSNDYFNIQKKIEQERNLQKEALEKAKEYDKKEKEERESKK